MTNTLIEEDSKDDLVLKRSFAEGLLKTPDDPLGVAKSITSNFREALKMANSWVTDPFVIALKEELIAEHGARHFLTTREDYAREVIDKARDIKDPDSAHKYFNLYGNIMGYIEKPQTNNNINVQNVTNRVMLVPTRNDEDWEQGLLEQQNKLSNGK